ncbi:MAG: citrate/2-methylcitrate synthase [Candidatus Sumerlaeaceae bacterium]
MPSSLDSTSITKLILEAKDHAYREMGAVDVAPPPASVQWPVACEVKPGLEGAVAAESKIGFVDGQRGALVYRGYDIFDLCAHSNFEEVSYLLIHGALPDAAQLKAFTEDLRSRQQVLPVTAKLLRELPVNSLHPMKLLEASVIGAHATDAKDRGDAAGEAIDEMQAAYRLIAQMMTCTGMVARLRQGKDFVDPDPNLSHAANLVYALTGKKPDDATTRIMDVCLILHADHGMNASTFTAMVVTSTLSDLYFAVSGGLASLKGPLHGGANEAVLYDLEEIGSPDKVDEWFNTARERKRKVMGMGHRVYKAYDPRARVLKPLARLFASREPKVDALFDTAEKLEAVVLEEMGREKKIFPNVDFYSGLVYKAVGIETAMFTPLFAVSRVSGWVARCLEYRQNNRIFRPRGIYTGEINREYVPVTDR